MPQLNPRLSSEQWLAHRRHMILLEATGDSRFDDWMRTRRADRRHPGIIYDEDAADFVAERTPDWPDAPLPKAMIWVGYDPGAEEPLPDEQLANGGACS